MFKRRDFIKTLGLTSVGYFGLQEILLANPQNTQLTTVFKSIRIRGRVLNDGKGIHRVPVSDGRSVVLTNSSGEFDLYSASDRDFVFISIPAGFEIKKLTNGSADFFQKIDKTKSEQNVSFTLKRSFSNDENHHFLLLSDTQIQNEYEANQLLTVAAPDVQQTIKSLNDPNLFGIGCGDLVFDHLELFKEYNQSVQLYDTPFFQVIGNHDMDLGVRSDELSSSTFKSHFGPTYYSWNRGEVHYVVLDDVFYIGSKYIGYIDEEQLAWLEQDLAHVEKGKTVVIALHIPSYTGAVTRYPDRDTIGGTVSNREHLYKILEGYNAHLLSGHTHFNDNMINGHIFEHCHGTVCGAWWSGPICYDGTPNGYALYEAKGSELKWRYKGTGLDISEQFRVYDKGYHKDFPDQMSLNCWNYDPSWEISWFENGIKKGVPEKIVAIDPLSVELHLGPQLPKRREWVEPQLNDHMFFFNPESKDNLVVEAKDRFGNVYTKKI
ncbi:calcineurin-like phosphoesterase C-terminal domain-containing protein [Algoriphagus antarcticus]|uniref:Calcineurin-like phosphoesterase family protein n=1 Tax=Algoriphagus antarcticus TaxID=238540 RepID=A0A3E0E7J2_9BACT|nr:calcineurin-like phosphoesterase family protein [Algoriphagus antarcticus]REG94195.1 calcineurin-like phosphoesterase family protein [Algoriphagus antarcticus]